MPFCSTCDVELKDEDTEWLSASTVGDAVASGLRPPDGKLERTARRIAKGDIAVAEKTAELERQWVAGFIARSKDADPVCVCKDCKSKAAELLRVVL